MQQSVEHGGDQHFEFNIFFSFLKDRLGLLLFTIRAQLINLILIASKRNQTFHIFTKLVSNTVQDSGLKLKLNE